MSNVLIGIVGVVLFIGLSLAGASFFGPVVSDSIMESKANGTMNAISEVAVAVAMRNRELETTTAAAGNASQLVSDYMEELPTNPANNGAVMLLTSSGATSGGAATIVATKMSASQIDMCEYINRSGGGAANFVPLTGAVPSQKIGCMKASVAFGALGVNDLVAYMRIS